MPTNVIPYSRLQHARRCAGDREQWLLKRLGASEASILYRIEEPLPVRQGEGDDTEPFKLESESEGFAQLARLRWQLRGEPLLLLERTTDVVLQLLRTLYPAAAPTPLTTISLRPLRRSLFRKELYPWRVCVRTTARHLLVERLPRFADFMGIGVDLDDYSPAMPLGRCQAGYGGMKGKVGGYLINTTRNETYALTCAHVLGTKCASRLGPNGQPQAAPASQPPPLVGDIANAPDVALLSSSTPCFQRPREGAVIAAAASQPEIEQHIMKLLPVRKTHPDASRTQGLVTAVLSLIRIGERTYRFPHLSVVPRRVEYLAGALTLPMSRHFSAPGDSGGWICGRTATWFGMIVGGDSAGATFAVEPNALLDFVGTTVGAVSRAGGAGAPPVTALLNARTW